MWYIKSEENDKKDIPYDLLHEKDITINDLFKNITKRYGQMPALKSNNNGKSKTMTYSEYYNLSNKFSKKLLYTIGPHPRVGILSNNNMEWFCAHMGTLCAGGISIGLYPSSSSDNCSYITNNSCIDLLIVDGIEQLGKFYSVKIPTVKIILLIDSIENNVQDEEILKELMENISNNNSQINILSFQKFIDLKLGNNTTNTIIEIGKTYPEDTATIIYTSGTTGDPKGVVITHKNIISSIKSALNVIQSTSNVNVYIQEKYISYLPLNHVAAQMMDIYIPLVSVGIVHFADKNVLQNQNTLASILKDIRPTIFIGVPRVWEKIMEKIKEKQQDPKRFLNQLFVNKMIIKEMGLDKTKYFITASAPISNQTIIFFKNLGIELCNIYGMSETSGPISMSVPGCSKGSGLPVMDLKIEKTTGEILVKGDQVFKEYYKNKKATDEAFNDKGWFRTGDTGYIDRDGSLYVSGRIKELIITAGGENVSPLPIEDKLINELNNEMKYFDHVIVIGDQRKFISVLLIPTKNYTKKYTMKELIDSAITETNRKAPNNTHVIKKYIIIDNFDHVNCLTPTLKIKREYINQKYKKEIDNLYND